MVIPTDPVLLFYWSSKNKEKGAEMTMKVCNYLTKLPQKISIKSIETLRDYDLITLHVPAPKQRLCS